MSRLDVTNVRYSYDGVLNVLADVTFSIGDGAIVGLIGPNGSGKSTLIKNVFDLVRLQDGRIVIGGHEHVTVEAKSQVMYLASNDYLPEFLTGREYVELLASLYGTSIEDGQAKELFRKFSMEGRYDNLIEDYSHGMRKKTQLISALLLRRPLTVIDETLNGIDLEALHLCEKEFRNLRDEGKSVLLCTHDFSLLERLASRILFLDLGHLVCDEPIDELIVEHGSLSTLVFEYLDADGR